jgi:hypothetical protein
MERALSRDCMSHIKRSLGLSVFCGVSKCFLSLVVCSQKAKETKHFSIFFSVRKPDQLQALETILTFHETWALHRDPDRRCQGRNRRA